jgi:MFS family permease
MSLEETRKSPFTVPDFRFYLGMRLFSSLAIQMQSVAVGWQVYDMTHSPLALGFVGLAQFLPVFGFSLLAGHVADRFDRRLILLACLSLQLLCTALLLATVYSGSHRTAPIYGILVLFGVARAFSAPAAQALLPNLVPRESLGGAFAWSSSSFQIMTIIGPAIGGLAYGISPSAVFEIVAALTLASIAAAAAMRARHANERGRTGASWRSVVAGIAFIRANPAILGAISLDLFAVLFGGATALLPVFARDILTVGPLGLGLLRSASAVGALAAGIILAQRSLGRYSGWKMFISVAIFGAATIVFGLSTDFYLSLAALAILGASDMVSMLVRQNLVQRATPDSMRGRVSAVNFLFVGASNELGEMESGATAAWFGTVEAVVVGGIGTLVVLAIWLWKFPKLRDLDRLEDIQPAETIAA